ncbi:hydrogenase maturation protease [Wenjunlia vitaminophila]|uniref:hydrogenase maturation protease n=1 Tax=Wenjunlia vitaminophila TaxID=76728 RepID=UPI00036E0727|nr:hydrogenase maturation protease [Wenjunlia vitaminophila]
MSGNGRTVVVGVGNEFRRDDGVGWAVVGRLAELAERTSSLDGVVLTVSDGDPGRLIGTWRGAALCVVVDAAHAHPGCPGRVHRLEVTGGELRASASASSHGLGLGEAVELARVLGHLPPRLVVFAVEGADSSLGTGLSAPVRAAVAPLAERVRQEILRHRAAERASARGRAEADDLADDIADGVAGGVAGSGAGRRG